MAAPAGWCDGLVGLLEGQGARLAATRAGRGDHRRQRCCLRRQARRASIIPADIVVSNADAAWTYGTLLKPAASQALERRQARPGPLFDEPCSSGISARAAATDVPHHTILFGPRYRELLDDIFERKVLPRISASICTGRPRPIRRSRRPAAMRSTRLSPVPNLAGPTSTGRGGRALPASHPAAAGGNAAAGPRRHARHLAADDAARFPRRPALRPWRGLRARAACCCRAPGSGPITPQRGRRRALSRRRRHASRRGPARRALLRQDPRHGGAAMRQTRPPVWPPPFGATRGADLAACGTRPAAGGLEILPRRRACCCRATPAGTGDGALRLLPARRRRDRRGAGRCRDARRLTERLAAAYAGRPLDHPVDRAFAATVRTSPCRRRVPLALIEGLRLGCAGRRYETFADLCDYGVRVAGSVGVMMATADGPACAAGAGPGGRSRRRHAAHQHRPRRRRADAAPAGSTCRCPGCARPASIPTLPCRAPPFRRRSGSVVARLLAEADTLYARADAGIDALPASCRAGIRAARSIYAEIGREVARRGHDGVSQRAVVPAWRKLVPPAPRCRPPSSCLMRCRPASAARLLRRGTGCAIAQSG
jgi:hypothetical protein